MPRPQQMSTYKVKRSGQPAIIFVLSVVLVFFASATYGQEDKGSPSTTQTLVSTVNEVSLDLVVRDKKNRLVLDLRPEDIAVTDSGVPVRITDLHLVTGGGGSGRVVTLLFDRLDSAAAHNARDIAATVVKMAPGFSYADYYPEASQTDGTERDEF